MQPMSLEQLAKVLQTSISPVALISGVGLLLLSMTNRLGRAIDRARALSREIHRNPQGEHQRSVVQIRIIYQRARGLRLGIALASYSMLCASVIVVLVFGIHILNLRLHEAVMVLFAVSLIFLIAAIILFIKDISLSLAALTHEIGEHL